MTLKELRAKAIEARAAHEKALKNLAPAKLAYEEAYADCYQLHSAALWAENELGLAEKLAAVTHGCDALRGAASTRFKYKCGLCHRPMKQAYPAGGGDKDPEWVCANHPECPAGVNIIEDGE